MILFSFDPGVDAGFAIYDTSKKEFIKWGQVPIWQIFTLLESLTMTNDDRMDLLMYIEDPRQISGISEKALGAGWVRVLAGQMERYCLENGIKYHLIKPHEDYVKKGAVFVEQQTGIKTLKGHHNVHDAIMILFYYAI